jgi:hypothetical protein
MTTKTTTKPALPDGVLESDLKMKYPCTAQFDLWYCDRLGWVIPTLLIAASRRHGYAARTYAVTLDGHLCRVGAGPHVLRTVRVYVTKRRAKMLQKFIDLRQSGKADAGTVRDRISSRRAEGQLRRARGERSWYWTT